jgi:hypothetical protein
MIEKYANDSYATSSNVVGTEKKKNMHEESVELERISQFNETCENTKIELAK